MYTVENHTVCKGVSFESLEGFSGIAKIEGDYFQIFLVFFGLCHFIKSLLKQPIHKVWPWIRIITYGELQ